MNDYELKFEKSERRINSVVNKEYGAIVFEG